MALYEVEGSMLLCQAYKRLDMPRTNSSFVLLFWSANGHVHMYVSLSKLWVRHSSLRESMKPAT